MRWKGRLFNAANGGELPDKAKAAVDNGCDLGKWIYGEGQRHAGHADFDELVRKHRDFHATVGTVIDQIKAKHTDSAKQELLSGKFDQISREVIRLLVRCKAIIRRDGSSG